jgi:D-alanyl-D-alanine carboxypeptidase
VLAFQSRQKKAPENPGQQAKGGRRGIASRADLSRYFLGICCQCGCGHIPLQAAPFAAIVMDGRTGEVLYEKNADTRLHPASLTKMMTLYIVFQEIEAGRLTLDTKVTVTKYAASQPPSRLGPEAWPEDRGALPDPRGGHQVGE